MEAELLSPIDGFVVQKWMRDRKLTGAPQTATAVNADHRDDLQLIFNHLDTRRRGKISLDAIRDALGIVALSEDPDRHAHLSENIISCFHAPDRLKLTGGATVDFKQFAAVMSSQEGGRAFPTLQDELKSDGLVASTTHFANLFRREVIVRGILDGGGADTLMSSTFKELFKAAGSAALAGDHAQKLRLHAAALENKRKRALEGRRSALARRVLVKRSSCSSRNPGSREPSSCPPVVRSLSSAILQDGVLPQAAQVGKSLEADGILGGGGGTLDDGLVNTEQAKACSKGVSPKNLISSKRREWLDSPRQKKTPCLGDSGAQENTAVKREALRQASAVLGLSYDSPTPPRSTAQVVAGIVETFRRRRGWWRGGTAAQDQHHARDNDIATVAGGFARCPSATVVRLRRRARRRCSAPTWPQQDAQASRTGWTSSGEGTGEGGNPGTVAVGNPSPGGNTSTKKLLLPSNKRLYGRRGFARLPCWALCDRGADAPDCSGRRRTISLAGDEHEGANHPPSPRDSAAVSGEVTDAVVEAGEKGERGRRGGGGGGGGGTESQQAVSRFPMTTATTTTATTTATAAATDGTVETEPLKTAPISVNLFPFVRCDRSDAIRSKEGGNGPEASGAGGTGGEATGKATSAAQTSLLPRRPMKAPNRTKMGRRGSIGHYASRDGAPAVPPLTPWRSPRVVRCMPRPRPPHGSDNA